MKKWLKSSFLVIVAPLLLHIQGCGSSGDACSGSTFVNQSTQSVTVSANSLSGISFSTFTLSPNASSSVCGNDTDDIMADVTWADGTTASKGQTNSAWNGFFCITETQILTGSTEANCS